MSEIYANAARKLSAIDFADENARIAERQVESERLTAGILKAEGRIAEVQSRLSGLLQERLAGHVSALAVADALLSDANAADAARQGPSERDMREELAKLRAGAKELQQRARTVAEEIAAIRNGAHERLAAPLGPVIADLMQKAREGAEAIARSYASLSALSTATKQGQREAETIGGALARLDNAHDRLINVSDGLDVPEDIAELIGALSGKGRACPAILPKYVATPFDHQTSSLIAAAAARGAVG